MIEELHLPQEIRAKTNPKSSTGRLDVFTRVITDRSHRFDEIAAGYDGKLYLEVVPRSFAIRVKQGLSLNQVRLSHGDARLSDRELVTVHEEFPLLYLDSHALRASELSLADGLFLSLDIQGSPENIVGYRAKRNSLPVDLERIGKLKWQDYWEPVHPERGGRIVLEPEVFYLLLSAEGVSIPPSYAAEMLAYDPDRRRAAHPLRGLLRPRLRLLPSGESPRIARGAGGARPRRAFHGRAPPAGVQARVRAHGRRA